MKKGKSKKTGPQARGGEAHLHSKPGKDSFVTGQAASSGKSDTNDCMDSLCHGYTPGEGYQTEKGENESHG